MNSFSGLLSDLEILINKIDFQKLDDYVTSYTSRYILEINLAYVVLPFFIIQATS